LVGFEAVAGALLLRAETRAGIALTGGRADQSVDALAPDKPPQLARPKAGNVLDKDAVLRNLRVVQPVGLHGDRILIQRKQDAKTGTLKALREPSGACEQVHGRRRVQLLDPLHLGPPEVGAEVAQLAVFAERAQAAADFTTVLNE